VLHGGGTLNGVTRRANGSRRRRRSARNLYGHFRAHAAGVKELAVISVIAQEKRPEMGPRSFRIGPADDNKLLPVERFGFAQRPRFPGA
jgi:hypothetical protein